MYKRQNFINAELLAKERGIVIEYGTTNEKGAYTNLVKTKVITRNQENSITGSVFDGNQLRLVNILGYEMDLNPIGNMLFVKNKDVPGVIGKVGTLLGNHEINIEAYLLSNDEHQDEAFAAIRLDNQASPEVLDLLMEIPEIISVQQLYC